MPWYCGFCSRWNRSNQRVCPYCGRAARGRVCRRCREAVPRDADFCGHCGSDNLSQPGGGQVRLPRWLRLAAAIAAVLMTWMAIHLAMPWLVRAWYWTVQLLLNVALWVAIFWAVTALLPRPVGQLLRRVAWWLIRFLARFVANLVH